MNNFPKVSIIIINWNGKNDTIECLNSLFKIQYNNYDVILVDNASTDDSVIEIKKYLNARLDSTETTFKKIKIMEYEYNNKQIQKNHSLNKKPTIKTKNLFLIENDQNYGFAKGNNIAIDFSMKNLNPDFVLLLNNDTVVDEFFLFEMIMAADKHPSCGFFGPKIYFYEFERSKNIIAFAGGNLNRYRGTSSITGIKKRDKNFSMVRFVDYLEGSCLLVRTQTIEDIGVLDPEYFTYWEEIDWCIRGQKAEYFSLFVPNSKIWHKISASDTGGKRIYYFKRNQFLFMRKNASKIQQISFIFYFFLIQFWIESAVHLIYKQDFKGFIYSVKGVYKGLNMFYRS